MDILSVENLSFGYDDCPVFKNFSCSISAGEICLIDGKNGSGKTTLLKCMTSLINEGENIYYKGESVKENRELLKNISYIMSEDTLYDYLTVAENIDFYKNLFSESAEFVEKIMSILKELGCEQYKNFLIKNLSQGTRNKVYLSIMISKNSTILILDEPFTALDKCSQEYFIKYIYKQNQNTGKTIVLVTHINQFKSIATKTIIVEKMEV